MAKDYIVRVPRKHEDVFVVHAETEEQAKEFVSQGHITDQNVEIVPADLQNTDFQRTWIVEARDS